MGGMERPRPNLACLAISYSWLYYSSVTESTVRPSLRITYVESVKAERTVDHQRRCLRR